MKQMGIAVCLIVACFWIFKDDAKSMEQQNKLSPANLAKEVSKANYL